MGKKTETNRSYRDRNASVTVSVSFMVHLICVLGLAIAFWVAQNVYSINLVSDPTQTLILLWVVESPIVILLYSLLRRNPEQCSYLKAVGRGIVGLPIGALLMAFGAVILGAPIGIQYLEKTVNWSLLMSLFTPVEVLDYIICVPAHGAVIGTWLGAWPMPLDWERPWQEWPVCVSYGAVAGYLLGILASLAFMLVFGGRRQHLKGE